MDCSCLFCFLKKHPNRSQKPNAASTCLLPGRGMEPNTPAAVIHLLCPPRGRRCRIQIEGLKYSFNKRRTPPTVWSDSTWMRRSRSKHKPEQVSMLPRRLVQPHGESTGRIIFPLTAPRPSPSMNQPNFSQNCGSTHRRDAVRRFMKLPVASRAPGAVLDYKKPSKELFQEETRCLFVRSLHVTLKRFCFLNLFYRCV